MSSSFVPPPYPTSISPGVKSPIARLLSSTGLKLLLLCGLALFMSIGALFLDRMVDERTKRGAGVLHDVSARVGGPQSFLGPTLMLPYRTAAAPNQPSRSGVLAVSPVAGAAQVSSQSEERHISLFKVPVFRADAVMQATFDLTDVEGNLPEDATADWPHAELVVGVSDARGALKDATLTTPGEVRVLTPASTVSSLPVQNGEAGSGLTLFGTPLPADLHAVARFDVKAHLNFSGAQRISVLPYAKSTKVSMSGDWRSPGFDGAFTPSDSSVAADGFRAVWVVPFIARGVRAVGEAGTLTALLHGAVGVSLIEVADPYQSITRSIKYAPLFLGLVFLTYFVFEVTSKQRVHIAQYVLVGVAQLIFYLLLLSMGERIGFGWGFLLAGGSTVLLLATNVAWIFHSRMQGARAGAVFGVLYGMIYMLLRLEDNALLAGALGSFAVVAAAMYFTRDINWYGSEAPAASASAPQGMRVGEL